MGLPDKKLGKRPPRHDPRTMKLSNYITPPLVAPDTLDLTQGRTDFGMMGNGLDPANPPAIPDGAGDCALAAPAHLKQVWTAGAGAVFDMSTIDVLADYAAVTGFDSTTGEGDNGANMLDVLKYLKKIGRIGAYASIDFKNIDRVKQAAFLGEGIYVGFAMPITAQGKVAWLVEGATDQGDGQPGSWGGHAVAGVKYGRTVIVLVTVDGIWFVSWGVLYFASWGFFATYCDEAYVIFSEDQIDPTTGLSADGFDLAAFNADLSVVTGGT